MNDSRMRWPAQSVIATHANSGPVVAAQHGRVATRLSDAVEFVDENAGGEEAFGQAAEAFASELVDDSTRS
jgi:hypothetical protein